MDRLIEFFTSSVGWLSPQYLFEILIIYVVIYTFLRFMEGTRGEGILKGIALLMLMFPLLLAIVAEQFGIMDRLLVIIQQPIQTIMQPAPNELRTRIPFLCR